MQLLLFELKKKEFNILKYNFSFSEIIDLFTNVKKLNKILF